MGITPMMVMIVIGMVILAAMMAAEIGGNEK